MNAPKKTVCKTNNQGGASLWLRSTYLWYESMALSRTLHTCIEGFDEVLAGLCSFPLDTGEESIHHVSHSLPGRRYGKLWRGGGGGLGWQNAKELRYCQPFKAWRPRFLTWKQVDHTSEANLLLQASQHSALLILAPGQGSSIWAVLIPPKAFATVQAHTTADPYLSS